MLLTKLKGSQTINIVPRSNIDWDKKVSIPQLVVKQFLFQFWKNDQVAEEFFIPGSKLRLDLFNFTKKIAIEVSPDSYHLGYNNWLHKSRINYADKVKKDEEKRIWCETNKIELIELHNEDIKALSKEYILKEYGISL